MASIESSPSPAAETDIVTLRSSDGEMFEVEPAAARMSRTIRCMMEEEDNLVSFFPVFNVTGPILAKVAEYIRRHASAATVDEKASIPNDALIKFDKEFIMVDQDTLFDIMLAAHYLDIKSLLDLTCRTVADMMRDRRPEEIRQTFHIKNDYTPEEEEEVRRENAWAFARRENTWAFDY